MKYVGIATIVLALCSGAWAEEAATERTIEEIERATRMAWIQCGSLTADIAVAAELPMAEETVHITGAGTLEYLRHGGKELFRQKVSTQMPGPMEMEMTVEGIFDGVTYHQTSRVAGREDTRQFKPSMAEGVTPPGGAALFDAMEAGLELEAKADGVIDGHPVFVVEGAPKGRERMPFKRIVISIDQKIGVLRRVEMFNFGTSPGATMAFKNIQVDVEIAPERFQVTPPSG